MDYSMPGFRVLHYLPGFAQTHVHWAGDAIQSFHLLLTPSLPALSHSQDEVFSNELALCVTWPNYWSFSINPSNKYSELISLRIDWFDLLAIQGTLKSLLQNHSSKALILQCSVFFIVQFLHPYITTVNTTALTKRTFVSKVMSLVFNTLSRFVIAFLPRSKSF